MKKLYMMMLLVMAGTMAMAQTSVWHGGRQIWTRGEGTESHPYLIESADNLAFLAYMVNKGYDTYGLYFRLTTDIDLNGSEDQQWVPIGLAYKWFSEDGCDRGNPNNFYADTYFRGHFDGGEHSISNIYINTEGENAGLFGHVQGNYYDDPAVIENVFVTSGYIKGSVCGGIMAYGSNNTTLVSRCWNGATIEGFDVGGIVGVSANKVYNCYNVGNLSGTNVGGIVGGRNQNGAGAREIIECFNTGDITASEYGGGIIGFARQSTTIDNCYNTGSVSGTGDPGNYWPAAGGLVGANYQGTCAITNCYNVGEVSSTNYLGCLIGYPMGNITVENSYYLNTCNESGYGEPKSEDYMRSQEFVDYLNGRNRDQVWALDEDYINDGFPVLIEANYLEVSEQSETVFNVYPNPAQGRFTVEGTGRMTVSNLLGQVVLVKEIDGQTTVALPQGMYFVKLGNEIRKIVVE